MKGLLFYGVVGLLSFWEDWVHLVYDFLEVLVEVAWIFLESWEHFVENLVSEGFVLFSDKFIHLLSTYSFIMVPRFPIISTLPIIPTFSIESIGLTATFYLIRLVLRQYLHDFQLRKYGLFLFLFHDVPFVELIGEDSMGKLSTGIIIFGGRRLLVIICIVISERYIILMKVLTDSIMRISFESSVRDTHSFFKNIKI